MQVIPCGERCFRCRTTHATAARVGYTSLPVRCFPPNYNAMEVVGRCSRKLNRIRWSVLHWGDLCALSWHGAPLRRHCGSRSTSSNCPAMRRNQYWMGLYRSEVAGYTSWSAQGGIPSSSNRRRRSLAGYTSPTTKYGCGLDLAYDQRGETRCLPYVRCIKNNGLGIPPPDGPYTDTWSSTCRRRPHHSRSLSASFGTSMHLLYARSFCHS